MSQKALDDFLKAVRAINSNFRESGSSLKHLIAELRKQIRENRILIMSPDHARELTKKPDDKRLSAYENAIDALCLAWGAPPVAPPPPVFQPPARIICDAVVNLPANLLIATHHDALAAMGQYAVGDALRFNCVHEAVLQREATMRLDDTRTRLMAQAEQAAGGKKSYRQSTLRSVHEKVQAAKSGICTTFALAAAHILTSGVRQDIRTARVEIIGSWNGMNTHMYVLVARRGDLTNHKSWGLDCRLVDCWVAAKENGGQFCFDPFNWAANTPILMNLEQFYDSTAPEPAEDVQFQQCNAVSLSLHMAQREEKKKVVLDAEAAAVQFALRDCSVCGKRVSAVFLAKHQLTCRGTLGT